jgi:hypothetical protein
MSADASTAPPAALEVGRVSVTPAEFRLVHYDAATIAEIATEMAARLGVPNPIRIVVDETTQLAKLSAEVGASSDDTIIIRVESGALEDTRRFTRFGERAARESIGRMLLRGRDRMRPDFAAAPEDLHLTRRQNAAWDAYCAGRLEREGVPVNQQRFRYNYRNRFGFSDASDAAFDRIWAADDLGWDELTAAP